MKHLVATVGSNPIPVLMWCLDGTRKPDRVTLIATSTVSHNDSFDRAIRVKALVENLGIPCDDVVAVDGFDFAATRDEISNIHPADGEPLILIYSGGTQLMSVALASAFPGRPNTQFVEAPFGGDKVFLDSLGVQNHISLKRSITPQEMALAHDVHLIKSLDAVDQFEATVFREVQSGINKADWVLSPDFTTNVECDLEPTAFDHDPYTFEGDLFIVCGHIGYFASLKSSHRPGDLAFAEAKVRARHLGGIHAEACVISGNPDQPLEGACHRDFPTVRKFSLADMQQFAKNPDASAFGKWLKGQL